VEASKIFDLMLSRSVNRALTCVRALMWGWGVTGVLAWPSVALLAPLPRIRLPGRAWPLDSERLRCARERGGLRARDGLLHGRSEVTSDGCE
jgi:hypothetical protein